MSSPAHRYPVDRYLVESSKTFGKVNILDDDLWNSEPALRPEDEIILRKLQEMLQSTAEDLKLLSQEIIMNKDNRNRVKTLPTPLDEDFNEKVHIKEVVDAKFHGYKVIDSQEYENPKNLFNNMVKSASINKPINAKTVDKNINTNTEFIPKTQPLPKKLGITETRTLTIMNEDDLNQNNINNVIPQKKIEKQKILYNEYCHKYPESKPLVSVQSNLKVQHMPSINIRSELKEQKVLQLDIVPETSEIEEVVQQLNKNVAVHSVTHETSPTKIAFDSKKPPQIQTAYLQSKQPLRRVMKMSTCDSSDSSNTHLNKNAQVKVNVRSVPTNTALSETLKYTSAKSKKKQFSTNKNLEMWKRKLNAVYGHTKKSPKKRISVSARKNPVTNISSETNTPRSHLKHQLNNSQYIPYSKLTVGGVRASDIEKEIGDIKDKNQAHIGPIIDKILSSREQSFNEDKNNNPDSIKVLDTSDEKLLQEVIEIEDIVSKTLDDQKASKEKHNKQPDIPKIKIVQEDSSSEETYDDDFEDDKSEIVANETDVESAHSDVSLKRDDKYCERHERSEREPERKYNAPTADINNKTYVKSLNLSFKKSVDVFEFVPSISTQEISTQSYTAQKISLKETQTSPLPDENTSPPPQIHNDLWPTIDPKGEVEKMFKLEKEFIKKLILEEYGDILETISKPSTSKDTKPASQQHSNIISTQKITQTSPAKVKSAMTSPRTTKTRMTSPFALSVTVNQQTSPVEMNNQDELRIELDDSHEDLGISINLSSPRFSLKLPQNSREVLSNLEVCSQTFIRSPKHKGPISEANRKHSKTFTKTVISSSSSSDELNTSEISSLGEVTLKLRKKLRRSNASAITESSSSSSVKSVSDYQSHSILPLRSEGEISVGQITKNLVPSKSDGEVNSKTRKKK